MNDPTSEVRALVLRHAAPSSSELLPNLTAWTSYGPKPPTPVLYEPMLYFTVQGIKRMTVGERQLDHRPGTFLLASIDVPVAPHTPCSETEPIAGAALIILGAWCATWHTLASWKVVPVAAVGHKKRDFRAGLALASR